MYLIFLLSTLQITSQELNLEILKKTITTLSNIERVFYTSSFEGNEEGVTYINSEDAIYFDFSNSTRNKTPKYYIKNKESELIFDGESHVQSLVSEKLIATGGSRNPNNPLLLTLHPIKELLPQLITNENVEIKRSNDVFVNEQKNYQFEFVLKNSNIDWERLRINTFDLADVKYTTYILNINTSDYLPSKIIMPNGPSGTMSRTIENVNLNYKVDPNLWTGDLLPNEFTKISFGDYVKQMQEKMMLQVKESTAKNETKKIENWELPNLDNDKLIDFSTFKGNVVLLEFWFKFCGPCVKAVPELNALSEKYKNENFLLYGIEFRENFPKENLQEYTSKIKMSYPTLYKGKELADKYSVQAAPTVMIIDKKGTIIYVASGFDKEKIESIIKDNL
ncbi:Thiol-disulfide isomerase or thioredoxin [Dokdonia pacifica]|uniref:Thiol-disulfide isomerase or thioredoxin n=1 Tax=Dokdonia pacifica TaxID=1627892 RepID=A0A238WMF6_9FLAO|nr:Thiol-disulfide isomerase or thioredoxin [Dokdonia pacifica]